MRSAHIALAVALPLVTGVEAQAFGRDRDVPVSHVVVRTPDGYRHVPHGVTATPAHVEIGGNDAHRVDRAKTHIIVDSSVLAERGRAYVQPVVPTTLRIPGCNCR